VSLLHKDKGPMGTRYRMREKLFAIGDDYWIETEDGDRAFKVNGKAVRLRNTFILEGPSGEELFKVQEKKLHIRDTMEIERDGSTLATVKKAMITPLHDRFAIEIEGGGELSAKGNIVNHEYEIERDGHKIAEVSKRWLRVRETYGIDIGPGEEDALILAAAVCIDEMGGRRDRRRDSRPHSSAESRAHGRSVELSGVPDGWAAPDAQSRGAGASCEGRSVDLSARPNHDQGVQCQSQLPTIRCSKSSGRC
jgi:uncharacterized protein YxjI